MKRTRKTFKAILVVLLVGVVISVGSWAFAQGGGASGSVNYTLPASKPGYDYMTAPDVLELSDMIPNRTVNISMGEKSGLKEKPMQTHTGPVLGDGYRQELPHPSPGNPRLPPSSQRVRPACLPQLCRAVRGKNLQYEPVNLLGPPQPWALGGRHGRLQREPVHASVSGIHVPWIRAIGGPQLLGIAPLHQRGQLSLGNGRREHTALHQ